MPCPSCGNENAPGQKFCGECGTPLGCPCPSCGAANAPGEKFCGECGLAARRDRVGAWPRRGLRARPRPPSAASSPSSSPTSSGFTTLSESRDSEEVRELLSRYFDTCRR